MVGRDRRGMPPALDRGARTTRGAADRPRGAADRPRGCGRSGRRGRHRPDHAAPDHRGCRRRRHSPAAGDRLARPAPNRGPRAARRALGHGVPRPRRPRDRRPLPGRCRGELDRAPRARCVEADPALRRAVVVAHREADRRVGRLRGEPGRLLAVRLQARRVGRPARLEVAGRAVRPLVAAAARAADGPPRRADRGCRRAPRRSRRRAAHRGSRRQAVRGARVRRRPAGRGRAVVRHHCDDRDDAPPVPRGDPAGAALPRGDPGSVARRAPGAARVLDGRVVQARVRGDRGRPRGGARHPSGGPVRGAPDGIPAGLDGPRPPAVLDARRQVPGTGGQGCAPRIRGHPRPGARLSRHPRGARLRASRRLGADGSQEQGADPGAAHLGWRVAVTSRRAALRGRLRAARLAAAHARSGGARRGDRRHARPRHPRRSGRRRGGDGPTSPIGSSPTQQPIAPTRTSTDRSTCRCTTG